MKRLIKSLVTGLLAVSMVCTMIPAVNAQAKSKTSVDSDFYSSFVGRYTSDIKRYEKNMNEDDMDKSYPWPITIDNPKKKASYSIRSLSSGLKSQTLNGNRLTYHTLMR